MGAPRGRNTPDLTRLLHEEGFRFDFFQAVRLLQRERPDREPVGQGDDPQREGVRFRSQVSLAFAPSDIVEITPEADGDGPAGMTVSFLGVATPASYGSLPLPYAELILGQERSRHGALRAFLDVFNHRLVSLFYRAWEKHRFAVAYERAGAAGSSLFERAVFCLMGMGTPAQRGRLACDDRALLARAYAVRGRGVSAHGLAELARSYFRVPVAVQQFVPCWYRIDDDEVCRLGVGGCRLGGDLHLGRRVRLAQSRFRLRLGPLPWPRFRDFLPTGEGFRPLVEMAALAAGPEHDFDCQLILDAAAAPGLRLGVADERGAPWLGWSTWLHNRPLAQDPADVIIDGDPGAAVARASA